MLTGLLPGMAQFSLSAINPLYDQNWDSFFQKALHFNPDERFLDADAMGAELAKLEVHWQKDLQREKENAQPPRTSCPKVSLRKKPTNIWGGKARNFMGLNERSQPLDYIDNCLEPIPGGVIRDLATGLCWQQGGSKYFLGGFDLQHFYQAFGGDRSGY